MAVLMIRVLFAASIVLFSLSRPGLSGTPNIVLIVADDLGYGDLGCYGSQTNPTPNIDSLARSGVRFTDFHSSGPMCTPTRVSILTGLYQQRFGPTFDGPLAGDTQRRHGLPHSATTVAEILKQNDYATACFGKWHLGFQPPYLPTNQGFDEFRGLAAGDGDHHSHIDRYGNEDWWHNDKVEMESGYTADLLTKYSIDFIEQHRDEPFFLYVPHLAIHFPWQGPNDPPQRVKGQDYRLDKWGIIPDRNNVHRHVNEMISAIDRSTGRIVETLERLKLRKQTLVIFTSDNGGYLNYGNQFRNISSNGELRGQKGTLYEGGHRVPLIVSCRGSIEPAESDALTHSNDLLPTIASFAGLDVTRLRTDGHDLSSLLLDDQPLDERTLFWRAGDDWAIRKGPWKLVSEQGGRELFHLHHDVREMKDVSTQNSVLVEQLTETWQQWNKTMPE